VERPKAQAREETTIDTYVLRNAPEYKNNLLGILEFTSHAKTSKIIRYEDFILKKLGLCQEITQTLCSSTSEEIDASSLDLESIASARDVIPENERPNQHLRRALPGDHVEKLNPETIDQLNTIFAEVLLEYGYMNA
jgi:hypothetical protein